MIRGYVRSGVDAPADRRASHKLSFRDLRVLEAIKHLVAEGVPWSRVRRQLRALKQRLPGASLSELSLDSYEGHVVVREQSRAWRADTGQMVFRYEANEKNGALHAIPVRREAPGPEPIAGMTADDWFERAAALEDHDSERAIDAYERALRLRPDSTEIWINLGRLFAEKGASERASACFIEALAVDPSDATALYNLGVVSQDTGNDTDAIDLYQRALKIDPNIAEAHYNLATIFDRSGDMRSAIRHINEYRKLTR
jgi:tetratricopeptide (TPR) repeat protein